MPTLPRCNVNSRERRTQDPMVAKSQDQRVISPDGPLTHLPHVKHHQSGDLTNQCSGLLRILGDHSQHETSMDLNMFFLCKPPQVMEHFLLFLNLEGSGTCSPTFSSTLPGQAASEFLSVHVGNVSAIQKKRTHRQNTELLPCWIL